ncbi:SDR family NAD(P)-dependent oxidoreductase, partial [candidate division CSSED10-310 bacterium]
LGAVGIVLEHAQAMHDRGMRGLAELMGIDFGNSAYHASRLDIPHIKGFLDNFMSRMERTYGLDRAHLAPETMFMSHETYTPARGGSAAAEVESLRAVFAENADQIIIANTKGFTGHAMGAGIEEVVTVKALQQQQIPPIAHFRETDPELGHLNLSRGGAYPIKYGLKFAAGFGSQLAISLFHRIAGSEERIADPTTHQQWLRAISGMDEPELEVVNKTLRVKTIARIIKSDQSGAAPHQAPGPGDSTRPEPLAVNEGDQTLDQISAAILGLVAEQTGYPVDMLEPDLDLEADLGIDTVKQAEVFARIREQYELPRREDLQLRDYPTLTHLIQYVRENRPDLISASGLQQVGSAPVAQESATPESTIREQVLHLVAEKTGYPVDMLESDLDLEADLGIDTVKQAEVFSLLREQFSLPRSENLQLRDYPTLQHLISYVQQHRAAQSTSGLPNQDLQPAPQPEKEPPADPVSESILLLVAEKTGYPVDMLETDLDLEADLGIDTVKQAEIFAEIRERYSLPRQADLQLRDYPTLKHLIDYVQENKPTGQNLASASTEIESTISSAADSEELKRLVPEIVPCPLPDNSPRVITFSSGQTVLITADRPQGVWHYLAQRCSDQGAHVVVLTDHKDLTSSTFEVVPVDFTDPDDLSQKLDQIKQDRPLLRGVIHLLGLDKEPEMSDITLTLWRRETARRVKSLFLIAQNLQPELENQAGFLISATAMGGSFGLESMPANSPLSGGISGLTKALNKELTPVKVKICDFPLNLPERQVSDALWNELPGPVPGAEVCFPDGERSAIQLIPLPLNLKREPNLSLDEKTVFLISGGVQGVTAEIAKDLARQYKPRIILLDIVAIPENIRELAALDENQLQHFKQNLKVELSLKHKRVTPVMLEREFSHYIRAIKAQNTLDALQALGATVSYHLCDVTREDIVKQTITSIGDLYGKIDVLIHGAGLEDSKSLAHKKWLSFNHIFDVKADGCFNLVNHAQPLGLNSVILFSSVAGRFGNKGQTDYAAANDLLNKYAAWLNHHHPHLKAIALNWTGWAEVGMATKESIKKIFEQEGITFIPLQQGTPMVRQEIQHCGPESEIVIAGKLGFLDSENQIVAAHESNAALKAQKTIQEQAARFSLLEQVVSFIPKRTLIVSRELNPDNDLFLQDHSLDGVPLFPGVMGLEAFAQAALLMYPNLRIQSMENIQFNQALKIFKGKSMPLRICLEQILTADSTVKLQASLETDFLGKDGRKLGQTRQHFTGIIVLGSDEKPAPLHSQAFVSPVTHELEPDDIYDILFHGPTFQVCDNLSYYQHTGTKAKYHQIKSPLLKKTVPLWNINPLHIELGLQAAGLYEYLNREKFGLPSRIDRILFHGEFQDNLDECYAIAMLDDKNNGAGLFSIKIVCGQKCYIELQGYKTITQIKMEPVER